MKHQDYKELAERMEADAFHRGCALSVLVEDIYDQRFWECLIENVKPDLKDKIDFPNPTPKGTRGKNILKQYKSFVKKILLFALIVIVNICTTIMFGIVLIIFTIQSFIAKKTSSVIISH
jgi:hypothetical protein